MQAISRRELIKKGGQAAAAALGLGLGPRLVRAQPREVRVAALLSVSGPNAAWGQKTWYGIEMATEMLNARGGLTNWGGAQIKVDLFDTESQPSVAGSQMQRIANSDHLIVTGCNQSPASIVASQIGERERLPLISATDADPLLTSRGFKYVFRTIPLMGAFARSMLSFVADQGRRTGVAVKRIAILCENSIIGDTASKELAAQAKDFGFEVYDVSTYDAAVTRDFTGYISRYKSANVDMVVGHNKPTDAILITRAQKELGFNPIAYAGIIGGHESVEYTDTLGSDANDVLFVTTWAPDLQIPGMAEVMQEYEARYNVAGDAYFAAGFSVMSAIYDAINRASALNRQAVRDALAATKLNTGDLFYFQLDGLEFDEKGDNKRAGGVIIQLQDRRWNLVGPQEFATQEAVWPKRPWA